MTIATHAERASGSDVRSLLRSVAVAGVAAMLAGLLAGGLGSRLAMRLAAAMAGEAADGRLTEAGAVVGEITAGGTMFLFLLAGIGSGVVGLGTYLAVRPWLPVRRGLRAVAFGGFELAVFGTLIVDPSNPDFTILDHRAFNVAMFAALFVTHGVLLVLFEPRVDRLIPVDRPARALSAITTDLGATGFALAAVLGVVAFVQAPGGIHAAFALAVIACGVVRASLGERASPGARSALTVGGYAAFAALTWLGAAELFDAVTTIA